MAICGAFLVQFFAVQQKLWGGEKILSPRYIFNWGGGESPSSPPGIDVTALVICCRCCGVGYGHSAMHRANIRPYAAAFSNTSQHSVVPAGNTRGVRDTTHIHGDMSAVHRCRIRPISRKRNANHKQQSFTLGTRRFDAEIWNGVLFCHEDRSRIPRSS